MTLPIPTTYLEIKESYEARWGIGFMFGTDRPSPTLENDWGRDSIELIDPRYVYRTMPHSM